MILTEHLNKTVRDVAVFNVSIAFENVLNEGKKK